MATVQRYLDECTVSWKESNADFPMFDHKIQPVEKRRREKIFDRYIESMKAVKQGAPERRKFSSAEEHRVLHGTRTLLRDGLNFTDRQLGVMFSDDVIDVTRSFVRQARRFDTGLSFNDIFQACRNAWVMNGLQLVLGLPVALSPSVFAYSLLYPYTDNLIDSPDISLAEKSRFSKNFHRRLQGESPSPCNAKESIIFSLVEMIEGEYPRPAFPHVYESLTAIHEAQTRSVQLLHPCGSLPETEMLEICIAKGGTSVVADGYLVAGNLCSRQELFLFGYGTYLQLLDDMQDAQEDKAAGLQTVFSRTDNFLEANVNRTYWFGHDVISKLSCFGTQHIDTFSSLMHTSMDLLLMGTVAQNTALYSGGYAAAMEEYSPLSFSYMRSHNEQFIPYNGLLLQAIEAVAFNEYLPA